MKINYYGILFYSIIHIAFISAAIDHSERNLNDKDAGESKHTLLAEYYQTSHHSSLAGCPAVASCYSGGVEGVCVSASAGCCERCVSNEPKLLNC